MLIVVQASFLSIWRADGTVHGKSAGALDDMSRIGQQKCRPQHTFRELRFLDLQSIDCAQDCKAQNIVQTKPSVN